MRVEVVVVAVVFVSVSRPTAIVARCNPWRPWPTMAMATILTMLMMTMLRLGAARPRPRPWRVPFRVDKLVAEDRVVTTVTVLLWIVTRRALARHRRPQSNKAWRWQQQYMLDFAVYTKFD